eukprot:746820-Hanusia_phi.AAC.1
MNSDHDPVTGPAQTQRPHGLSLGPSGAPGRELSLSESPSFSQSGSLPGGGAGGCQKDLKTPGL